ncbi:MAG: hypothetical protein WCI73_03980 [Phycisphaerae bacterium]
MTGRTTWLAVVILAGAAGVWAQSTATNPATSPATATAPATPVSLSPQQVALGRKIDGLLPQLAADDFAVREEASKQLNDLGVAALPILRQRLTSISDAETKTRVGSLIEKLEEAAALSPTLVTLELKDAGIHDAVEALAKVVSFPIKAWPERGFGGNDNRGVTLQVDKQPFWFVIQKISDQTPIRPMNMGGNRKGLTLQINNAFPRRVVFSGAFAVAATSIDRQYRADLNKEPGGDETSKSFAISLATFSDPRLRVLRQPSRAVLTQAVDEKGNSLIPEGNVTGDLTNENSWGYCETSFSVPLRYPEAPGATLKSLKGELHAIVQTRTAAVDFADLSAKNVGKKLEGMEVTFESFTTTNPTSFAVKVKLRPGTMAKAMWQSIYQNNRQLLTVNLLDAQDKPVGENGGANGGGWDKEVSYQYNFNVQDESGGRNKPSFGPPAKLRLEIATRQKDVTIPFEFKDLPIP